MSEMKCNKNNEHDAKYIYLFQIKKSHVSFLIFSIWYIPYGTQSYHNNNNNKRKIKTNIHQGI